MLGTRGLSAPLGPALLRAATSDVPTPITCLLSPALPAAAYVPGPRLELEGKTNNRVILCFALTSGCQQSATRREGRKKSTTRAHSSTKLWLNQWCPQANPHGPCSPQASSPHPARQVQFRGSPSPLLKPALGFLSLVGQQQPLKPLPSSLIAPHTDFSCDMPRPLTQGYDQGLSMQLSCPLWLWAPSPICCMVNLLSLFCRNKYFFPNFSFWRICMDVQASMIHYYVSHILLVCEKARSKR